MSLRPSAAGRDFSRVSVVARRLLGSCPAFALLMTVFLSSGCQATRQSTVRLPARHSVRSEQLLVLSDMQLGSDHPLMVDLVSLRGQVAATLDLPDNAREVIVYLFDSEMAYRQYIESKYPGLPPRRAYFVGTPSELAVYTFWGERIQEDLRHEFTHGLLHASLKTVPLWLDEGLAEYFEVVGPQPGTINLDYAGRLATAILNNWRPDIARLERLQDVSQMQRVDYQEAWAWVHFMLHSDPDLKQELLSHLRDLRTMSHPGLLSTRLERMQPQFEDRFLSYVATLHLQSHVSRSN
jgi:hypothetical protein